MQTVNCGIVILAAGSSSRLGRAKQLLPYKNKTLLQHAINEAIAANAEKVVVVTGANENEIMSQMQTSSAQVIYNNKWADGMAGSMQAGLSALLSSYPHLGFVIIMLCDQPFVTTQLLNQMIQTKQTSAKGIVACMYKETLGVPALFDKIYFEQLLSLQGSDGAQKIIMLNTDDVAAIPFEPGAVDIDTESDYKRLLNQSSITI